MAISVAVDATKVVNKFTIHIIKNILKKNKPPSVLHRRPATYE